jgi:molybdopterin/thiamine biosynthesis adenylyltransferase
MILTVAITGLAVLALRYFGVSKVAQMALVLLAVTFVLLVQITLPTDNPLRQATGGSLRNWLLLLGFGAIVAGYNFGLTRLRKKAGPPDSQPADPKRFTDAELERYARHIVLREIGGPGQKKLKAARVLVIGAGGLGSPALMYLAAAGVGAIGVIDDDEVGLSNLQRQIIFTDADIDVPKVFAAQNRLAQINPHIIVYPYQRRLEPDIADTLFADFDLVLDGTDNFATRALVNRACVATGTPLISGAISQWEGQISLFDPARGGPCYACIFPNEPADGLAPSCAEAGVMGALPGVIGSMMAAEAIKWITGAGASLRGEMLIYDALYGESRKLTLAHNPQCPVCSAVQESPETVVRPINSI